jgi:hypothetical protein
MSNTSKPTGIPVIRTAQALESLRDSGHSLPTALGEPTDNSIESGANCIHIRLDDGVNHRGKKHVHRIAIADDGCGMEADTLQRYLVLGFSTRYMRTDTIGKYGVGAKLAALNFARRIDVWSRQSAELPWLHTFFDLTQAMEEEKAGREALILPPDEELVPEDLNDLLPEKSGTLVVWSDMDRLEEGRMAPSFEDLRYEVEKEMSRIFRAFINGGITIKVNGKALLPHDPLFLMEKTWAESVLQKEQSKQSGKPEKDHFPATIIANKETIPVAGSVATLTVTLYPPEVLRKRGMGGDDFARKIRVPDNQGCISFMRLDREVSYTNVPRIFPSGVEDPDRFIGIEVAFKPELDAYFGVRNVKRGVEPHGELREKLRKLLEKHIKSARVMVQEAWGKAAADERDNFGEHSAVTTAAKEVNRVMPKGRATGPTSKEEEEQILDDLATDVVGRGDEAEKQKYLENIKDLPFVVESVDWAGKTFIDVKHISNKVIIRLNTRHRFYREMWEPLKDISQRDAGSVSGDDAVKAARRTIEALTLLFIAYGKAESMDSDPVERYTDLTSYWGQFLDTMMTKVKGVI